MPKMKREKKDVSSLMPVSDAGETGSGGGVVITTCRHSGRIPLGGMSLPNQFEPFF